MVASVGILMIRVRGQLNQMLTLIMLLYTWTPLPSFCVICGVEILSVSLSHFTAHILFLSLSKRASEKED